MINCMGYAGWTATNSLVVLLWHGFISDLLASEPMVPRASVRSRSVWPVTPNELSQETV